MKNFYKIVFLITAVFAAGLVFAPAGNAQVIYNGGTYINQMIRDRMNARRRAAIYASRKKTARKAATKRKSSRSKSRRVSSIENFVIPRYKLDLNLPKRRDIV